jgi:murein DD-endopeptidase MepM/ murein hydrolase activator NlpD
VPRQLVLVVAALVMVLPPVAPGAEAAHVRYAPPVEGRVLQAFDPPSSDYGPGHRGVDLQAAPGARVRAAADGVVAHAGAVAGTTWVSLDHDDGVRTSYGPLDELEVSSGQSVARGSTLGRLAGGGHGPQGRDRGLHLGARRDGVYLDPMLLLVGRPSLVGSGRSGPVEGRGVSPASATSSATPPASEPVPTPERAAVPGPPRARHASGRRRPVHAPSTAERVRAGPVDGVAAQSLPSRHGPPSMVGLLHVKTTDSTRPPTGGPGAP